MKLVLTPEKMMEQWRLRRGVEPMRTDSAIARTDGHDFTGLLRAELDSWYARLLDTAPVEMLAPEDAGEQSELASATGFPTGAVLKLPAGVRRVLSVRLAHWHAGAQPEAASEALLRRQANPFAAATELCPSVIDTGGRLLLFPATPLSVVASVMAVTDRSPNEYRLDSRALELITPDMPMLL